MVLFARESPHDQNDFFPVGNSREGAQACHFVGIARPGLVRVLDDCDRARFAPTAGEAPAREAMLGRAQQILSDLDRA